ncbi:hypothetical protein KC319_g61 [Hortaea werneckii]|nr:hypothetical protein KC319_g61 [Hortaea werneckii]
MVEVDTWAFAVSACVESSSQGFDVVHSNMDRSLDSGAATERFCKAVRSSAASFRPRRCSSWRNAGQHLYKFCCAKECSKGEVRKAKSENEGIGTCGRQ